MSVKIQDISDEVHREIGEPSEISTASIAFWLQTNVGRLNSQLQSSLALNKQDLEIPNLNEDQKAIFKMMYLEYFFGKKMIEMMGAAGASAVLEVSTDGHRTRMVNKGELSKTYLNAKKNIQEEIKKLTNAYRVNSLELHQVAGDDTVIESARNYYR
jgi:hypothetical protein